MNQLKNQNLFEDKFAEREFYGRQALKELQNDYPEKFRFEIFENNDKYAHYDAYYFVLDHNTQSIKKRVWVEIKIRDRVFPDYFLEVKKWNNLEKERNALGLNKDEVVYLYLNFTPEGVYMWNISDIDKYEKEKRLMNKATSTDRNNKIDKEIVNLKTNDAYKFDYYLNKDLILKRYTDKLLLDITKQQIKKKGLEAVLFN